MPYSLTLQRYTLPEFFAEPPAEWVRRLREISPVTEKLSHLRFRYRAGSPDMLHPDAQVKGVWELYSCTPRAMVSKDRAKQFEKHWSELPASEQPGRKALVTTYQHYMWHVHGVDVKRFWVLQGERGGTPAQYTEMERAILRAAADHAAMQGDDMLVEEFPIGALPPCQFSELSVRAIQARDRLIQAGMNMDRLQRMDSSAALASETDAAEKRFRSEWLDWWYAQIQPQAEFMKWYLTKSEADQTLRRASHEEANSVTEWKDRWIEHGSIAGAGIASSTKIAVAVK